MGKLLLGLACIVVLAGCEKRADRVLFDGFYFPGSAKQVDEHRRVFNVQVNQATQSIEGARQAGAYEGVKYCIANYGNSDIAWIAGPDAENLTLDGETLLLQGRCTG